MNIEITRKEFQRIKEFFVTNPAAEVCTINVETEKEEEIKKTPNHDTLSKWVEAIGREGYGEIKKSPQWVQHSRPTYFQWEQGIAPSPKKELTELEKTRLEAEEFFKKYTTN